MSEHSKIQKLCKLLVNNNQENIKDIVLSLDQSTLSWLQYYSICCLKYNKGYANIGKKIITLLDEIFLDPFNGTITLTFGDVAESHVGMQKLGKMADKGFIKKDLLDAKKKFDDLGYETILIKLNDFLPKSKNIEDEEEKEFLETAKTDEDYQAYVFIVRNGINGLLDIGTNESLLNEMLFYNWDTKLYNEKRKVVQNKLARHNLNFDDTCKKADFNNGQGTTISFKDVPLVNSIRETLPIFFGKNAENLKCEGNKYYDSHKTGIGYHGDTERKKVIGLRLGKKMNMHWMWYYNDKPRGRNVNIQLQPGDIYCMSEKTVGTDWRPNNSLNIKKKRYVLRHAAGSEKYTTKASKVHIRNPVVYDKNIILHDIYFKPTTKNNSNFFKMPN
jgi:hypothetical protein